MSQKPPVLDLPPSKTTVSVYPEDRKWYYRIDFHNDKPSINGEITGDMLVGITEILAQKPLVESDSIYKLSSAQQQKLEASLEKDTSIYEHTPYVLKRI